VDDVDSFAVFDGNFLDVDFGIELKINWELLGSNLIGNATLQHLAKQQSDRIKFSAKNTHINHTLNWIS
jgi:hypothetical protein